MAFLNEHHGTMIWGLLGEGKVESIPGIMSSNPVTSLSLHGRSIVITSLDDLRDLHEAIALAIDWHERHPDPEQLTRLNQSKGAPVDP